MFSESEFTDENVKFVLAVLSYRDLYEVETNADLWKKKWRDIDTQLKLKERSQTHDDSCDDIEAQTDVWPSSAVNKINVLDRANEIMTDYIDTTSSTHEICVSAKTIANTKYRIQRIAQYGPSVFGECLQDPIKTMKNDVFPRFMKSQLYEEMNAAIVRMLSLPPPTDLHVPLPEESRVLYDTEEVDVSCLTLDDFLTDRFLFGEFLSYLVSQVSSETLLCVRHIMIFDQLEVVDVDIAWLIHLFFIAPGSSFELSY